MITIEAINGKAYTVVIPLGVELKEIEGAGWEAVDWQGVRYSVDRTVPNGDHVIAAALPALPRKPKPEDARLLYLYAAHGIDVRGRKIDDMYPEPVVVEDVCFQYGLEEITHATFNGERVEIAIEG
jgi:hypothetical protein